MTDLAQQLAAQQLAAHPRWAPRSGVLLAHTGGLPPYRWPHRGVSKPNHQRVPDLTDAATCGVLWRMLRDHWADAAYYSHRLELICDPDADCIVDLVWEEPTQGCEVTERLAEEVTEGEALAKALLAAWGTP